ncbi:MAG: hypothetical protein QOJ70_2670 [Acidobacteriota bacterium]|jgi:two-component system phosphate regulon response regulator PhoB|nr:hypothetical protein [Acidobacteriota bacterium]
MHYTKRPTVMIADSYEDTRSLLRFWLEGEGYGVVEVANGEEAVELTSDVCPDLLLMSERMRVLGGVEAARRIRQHGNECVFPIIAMSAYPTKEAKAFALAAGCDSFIHQPIDFDNLSNLLSSLLAGAPGMLPHQST